MSRSMGFEQLTARKAVTALLAMGVGYATLNGCTRASEPAAPAPEEAPVRIKYTYVAGQRITQWFENGVEMDKLATYCDGVDLIDASPALTNSQQERYPGHGACKDGRITPDDFPLPTNK